ncbi:MAG: nuclear transport factor 2 family protein [Rhodobacter sp.]|nr:nuclear transport factor 2 family protein [Rhodobacter sp.]
MSNRSVLETWIRRVWCEADSACIDEMLAPDGAVQGLGAHPLVGPAEFHGFADAIFALLHDFQIDIDRATEEGDWVHVLVTLRAKARSDGRDVVFPGQLLVRIADEKLAEAYNSVDFIAMFEQLGLLPENTFARCLSGQRVG